MSNASDERPVKISSPADVLGIVPWMVGFHPRESLVLICLRGPRNRTGLTMRIDLPPAAQETAMAEDLARRAEHERADAAVLVCYTEAGAQGRTLPRARFVNELCGALTRREIGWLHALLVRGGRWWSYDSRGPDSVPDGTRLPGQPTRAAARFAAEVALDGQVVLADREELERSVRGPTGTRLAVLSRGCDEAARRLAPDVGRDGAPTRALTLESLRSSLEAYVEGQRDLDDRVAVRLVVGLFDKQARDEVSTWVVDEHADVLLVLLTDLARQAPDDYCAPVCTVLAWVAWGCGNGALANVAIDRALAADPDYTLANLVRKGLDGQVHPRVLRSTSREIRRELRAADAAGRRVG